MKKSILLITLTLIVFVSCASRQTSVNKTDVNKDSIVETKSKIITLDNKEKIYSTNINTRRFEDEFTFTPIDSSKEVTIEGKTYKNVIVKIKKTKSDTSYQNNKKESEIKFKDSTASVSVHKKETTSSKTKDIVKKESYWKYIWWFILIIILSILWQNRQRVFNVL